MQLAIVMTEKGDVIRSELCGDVHMVEGSGMEHRWSQDSHMDQRIAGSGAEELEGLDSVISHPRTKLLGRSVGDGLQLQATACIQKHGKQRLAAADRRGRWIDQPLPEQKAIVG